MDAKRDAKLVTPTNVYAGKSRAHLSGGVLQMAAVIGYTQPRSAAK